jgi:hypothetical protein
VLAIPETALVAFQLALKIILTNVTQAMSEGLSSDAINDRMQALLSLPSLAFQPTGKPLSPAKARDIFYAIAQHRDPSQAFAEVNRLVNPYRQSLIRASRSPRPHEDLQAPNNAAFEG